jgi:hypothetical protein
MEVSISWGAASCSATQEFPKIVWNPNIHYHVYKASPLVHNLSQMNKVFVSKFHLAYFTSTSLQTSAKSTYLFRICVSTNISIILLFPSK